MFDHNDEVATMENPAGMDNQDTNIGDHDDNDDRVAEIALSCDPGSEKVENFGRK